MFNIEYVILRGGQPGVVERMTSASDDLAVAEQSARSGLDRVRLMRPDTPPDGYQILDMSGSVIRRSWV
jgi:hypothetical protein